MTNSCQVKASWFLKGLGMMPLESCSDKDDELSGSKIGHWFQLGGLI